MELASISKHVEKGTCDHLLGHRPARIGELRTIPGRSLINDSLQVSRMSIFLKRGTRRQTFIIDRRCPAGAAENNFREKLNLQLPQKLRARCPLPPADNDPGPFRAVPLPAVNRIQRIDSDSG